MSNALPGLRIVADVSVNEIIQERDAAKNELAEVKEELNTTRLQYKITTISDDGNEKSTEWGTRAMTENTFQDFAAIWIAAHAKSRNSRTAHDLYARRPTTLGVWVSALYFSPPFPC